MTEQSVAGRLPLLDAGLPATDALATRLFPPLGQEIRWGLERTLALLEAVGNPHERYPALHVGGTNGKGSVASLLASVLSASGLRVGLYTSPHLCSFRERVLVGGRAVSVGRFIDAAETLREPLARHAPSFFEASTALAFSVFAREEVDIAVVEVGLGGRLDATNVIRPLVSAVTNVALDHREYLGDDLESIAREKAGIVKEGVPFVTTVDDPALLALFRDVAEARGAPFHAVDARPDALEARVSAAGTAFTLPTAWGRLSLETPLVGLHQAANAALALRVLEELPETLRPDRRAVEEGVRAVRWPGRIQIERRGSRSWVFDVAHNTAGAHALAGALGRLELPRPLVLVAGILRDKEWSAMLPPLLEHADRAILTQPDSAPLGRRWDPEEAARAAGSALPLEVVPDFAEALERASVLGEGGTVVVTGSCHTVGDALSALGIAPFEEAAGPPAATRTA